MQKEFLLKLARQAIENFVENKKIISIPEKYPEELSEKKGVFVTIYKRTAGFKELKGCIGIPLPEKPLIEGIIDAAVSACKDPRFLPLKKEELKDIVIEISILTEPKLIEVKKPEEYLKKIEIGKDGLIIKKGVMGGILLPKVPVDQGWDVKRYLENICLKAGLLPETWKEPAVEIYKFQAEVIEKG